MLKTLRAMLSGVLRPAAETPRKVQLGHALAALLHEVTRMDLEVTPEDVDAARKGLVDLVGVSEQEAEALLDEARASTSRLTSYHDIVSVINASLSREQKVRLVEHMWRVAHADAQLDAHEDHLVRKVSDLLYLPHIECMLARQRARGTGPGG
jgi:uncharacterized tellurite resistance protein B-like protein